MVHEGPPLWHPNAQDFLARWGGAKKFAGPYIVRDRWAVDVPREHTTAPELIKAKLGQAGLGKNISENVASGRYRVLGRKDLMKSENALKLTQFFDKRFPWER